LDRNNQSPVFIAVIDDEPDLACLFKEALSQIDRAEVFSFSDPLLALEHFRANHQNYMVIISDYRMPTMTGMELLSKIKNVNSAVTTIMMSAFEIQDELFQECKCVDKFLQKPVLMTDLIKEVRMLVSKIQILGTNRIS
jgi:two-component system, cell cycle response regulator CpdR